MANRSSRNKQKITMSERYLLENFLVEAFEDAFSELEEDFGALNGVSLRGQ